jgi:hypothetical protein
MFISRENHEKELGITCFDSRTGRAMAELMFVKSMIITVAFLKKKLFI